MFRTAFMLGMAFALFSAAPAMATTLPEVGYLEASAVGSTGATIRASIDPEGSETSFEISLECQSASGGNQTCEPLTVGPQLKKGVLPAGIVPETVTDSVTGLQPGYTYRYSVIAANAAGREGIVGAGFVTCPAEGPCPAQPYMPGEALWNLEGARKSAEEAPRREAEREARQREAAERAVTERESREAAERAALARCVVPRLKGDSLRKARRALRAALCGVGIVTEPSAHSGTLIVIRQGVRAGRELAVGSRVGLSLGLRRTPARS